MDEVLVDERHLQRDFFSAPWFLRCCLIADACRASAAGLARSRRRILPTEDVGMLAARSRRVGGATAAAIEELNGLLVSSREPDKVSSGWLRA